MASNVKKIADEKGINPHQVALRAGLSYPAVLRVFREDEINEDRPIKMYTKIARVLGVNVGDLFDNNNK